MCSKPLPAARGVPAWNRYSLMVISVRIRSHYNNTDEENYENALMQLLCLIFGRP